MKFEVMLFPSIYWIINTIKRQLGNVSIFRLSNTGGWTVFFAQSDWLLYLGISCSTKNSQTIPKKLQGWAIKYSKIYFFYFLAMNALGMCFKMVFFLQMMSGRQAEVR